MAADFRLTKTAVHAILILRNQIAQKRSERGDGCLAEYDALKLENQVCFPLYACSKELVRQYGPFLKELNLTYTQYIVMMVLWERETVSSRDLAECLHLDYGTLTPVLKRLDQAGYLTRRRAEEDERLLTLTLTEAGRALMDRAVTIPPAIAACMGLTAEEFGTLYALTYKALRHMESNRTKEGE
ncbi:MAG: MarR family transcriptional regulator [Clostridia bacterium]|nr:MarR family transcriptional regulator [Clostridia bacterium]